MASYVAGAGAVAELVEEDQQEEDAQRAGAVYQTGEGGAVGGADALQEDYDRAEDEEDVELYADAEDASMPNDS